MIRTAYHRTEPRFVRAIRNATPEQHVGWVCAIVAVVVLWLLHTGVIR